MEAFVLGIDGRYDISEPRRLSFVPGQRRLDSEVLIVAVPEVCNTGVYSGSNGHHECEDACDVGADGER